MWWTASVTRSNPGEADRFRNSAPYGHHGTHFSDDFRNGLRVAAGSDRPRRRPFRIEGFGMVTCWRSIWGGMQALARWQVLRADLEPDSGNSDAVLSAGTWSRYAPEVTCGNQLAEPRETHDR